LLAASYQLFPARRDFCVVGPLRMPATREEKPNLCFDSASGFSG
jgi:hypothetical protein